MCAIDALGMGAMLGRDVTIISRDPHGGEPITVGVTAAGQAAWAPDTAVVFAGQQTACQSCPPEPSAGPPTVPPAGAAAAAAEVYCGYVNSFTSTAAARAWAAAHPQVSGQVLDQDSALRLGVAIFGPLLADPTE
ncbi:organomercurial lyase [Nonomuraea sp. NPDC003707]